MSDDKSATVQIVGLFMFVWITLGISAFVWSIYCFGKSGSMFQKFIGLVMAFFFGPLFSSCTNTAQHTANNMRELV